MRLLLIRASVVVGCNQPGAWPTVSHRGEISRSYDELAGAGWAFALTLGD